ncbi:UNVERIFIED_CONTAM: undecaprenyl/decaprenyl-phosphate alpha-N-acetylglucosaminyl 1-phosphate transferase [Spiribacter pallidus]|jgi:UDP-GlcNAc:undecaprenyl-phosphate GlcNAc-1-phosphate transferase
MLLDILPSALLGLGTSVLIVVMLDRPAVSLDLVDRPGGRKIHARSVPLIGGVAVLGGVTLGLLALPFSLSEQGLLIVAMTLTVAIGLFDDWRGLPTALRLLAQVLIACLMTLGGGPLITDLGSLPFAPDTLLELGILTIPLTVFAMVGYMNSTNMMDGADGLAGGVAVVIVVGLILAGIAAGDVTIPAAGVTFASALAGFLVFNLRGPWRRRASVFLGDNGSLAVGIVVIWLAIETAMLDSRVISPVGIGWLIAIPVVETLNLIVRRLLRRQNPFHADREHLHHILRRAGFSVGQTTAIIMTVVAVLGAGGMSASMLGVSDGWLWAGLVVLAIGHLIFTESGWRTVLALQRLRRWMAPPGKRLFIAGPPLTPERQALALTGFYLMVTTLPFNVNLPMLGLALLTTAVAFPGARFTRGVISAPLTWISLALAALVVIQGLRLNVSPGDLWHGFALSGVLALPLGWWLADRPRHLVGGTLVLIAALAGATALNERRSSGGPFAGLVHESGEGVALLAAIPLIACFVLLARQLRRVGRRRTRVRDGLLGALAVGVGLWLGQLVIQSFVSSVPAGPAVASATDTAGAQSALSKLMAVTGWPGVALFIGFFALLLFPIWRLYAERRWPLRWIVGLVILAVVMLVAIATPRTAPGTGQGAFFLTGSAVLWMAAIQSARLRRATAQTAQHKPVTSTGAGPQRSANKK